MSVLLLTNLPAKATLKAETPWKAFVEPDAELAVETPVAVLVGVIVAGAEAECAL